MDIVIYGCGAIGSVLATLIQSRNNSGKHQLHLVGRKKTMGLIDREGLIYVPYNSENHIKTTDYKTYTDINDVSKADVLFFTMKAYGLKKSIKAAKTLIEKENPTIILSMNGLGLREIVQKETNTDKIIEISVGYPSRMEDNKVINTGGNSVFIAPNDEFTTKTFKEIFIELDQTLPIEFKANFEEFQWKKGTANITMNGVSALTMLTVGQVLERKTLHSIMDRLIEETVAVAQELDKPLTMDVKDWFYSFAGKDPHHKTSTLQDVEKGKKTEIEFFNGYIVKKGKQLGIPTPINECLVRMLHIAEEDF